MDDGATAPTAPDTSPGSSSSSSSSSSSATFPLWAIIVIVVAGTAVFVGALVYGCIFLHRWRWARRHRRTVFIEGREVSVYHASSVSSSSNRSSSIIVGGGLGTGTGAGGTGAGAGAGTRDGDQNSLFFDDVDFWRGGGGWGSSVGYDDEEEEYYGDTGSGGGGGGGAGDSEGRRGRKLRKKKRKMQRGGSGRGGRRSSSGGFGGGTNSSIMSELSVGDIAMVEAGIIRQASSATKEGRTGSRRMRRDYSSNSINSNNRWRTTDQGGHKRKKTLSLPPTLPEVLRLSSGLLSVVSFASLSNLYNSLSNGGNSNNNNNNNNNNSSTNNNNNHDIAIQDLDDDGSKEVHVRTTSGGGPRRPSHRRTTSNAWIDEDAIHGPAVRVGANAGGKGKGKGRDKGKSSILSSPVGSRKGLWRRSIRESWPLRTMISPTLPKLSSPWGSPFGSPLFGSPKPGLGIGGGLSESSTMPSASGLLNSRYHYGGSGESGGYHHEGIASFRFPDQPILAPPGDDSRANGLVNYSPPRQLPKPPRQALLAASVESAGDSPLGYGYYRGSNWTTGARTMANNITPSRTASGRSVSGTSVGRSVSGASSERGLLSYYKYEETNEPVVLPNLYHYPVASSIGGSGSGSGGGGSGGGSSFVNGNVAGGNVAPGIAITTPRESVVPAPLRLSSADSTLSGILRDTEKRLQDGTVTGVMARRNQRISISPSKRTLGTSLSGPLRPGSANIGPSSGNEHIATLMITSAGGVRAAPSPAPPSPASSPSRALQHRASGHVRGDSQASMVSEADSLFAAPSPVQDHYHALTSPVKNGGVGLSPSGPPPQHPVPPLPLMRHNSFNGSLSSSGSSLPTIYSVDENADGDADDTRITAFGSSTSEGLNRLAGFVTTKSSSNTLDDPFVVNWPATTMTTTTASTATRSTPSPTRPVTSGRRGIGTQPSSGRSVPDFSQGPRLYGGPISRSEASLRSESPLGAISGNSSRAVDVRTRPIEPPPRSESRIPRVQTSSAQIPQSQSQSQSQSQQRNVVLLAAPTSSFSTAGGERHYEQKSIRLDMEGGNDEQNFIVHSSTIPNIFLTTPSEKGESPMPRHVEALRTQASSPTLGRGRDEASELAVPNPTLSNKISNLSSVYDYYMDIPLNDHPALSPHRRAAGEVRKMSATSSSAYSADPQKFERDKERALNELNKLIRSEHVAQGRSPRSGSTPAMGTNANENSVRWVPPEWLSNHMLATKPQHPTPSHPRTHRSQELLQPHYQDRRQNQNQNQDQNQKQQSQIPVSSTVAQLRRMNSQVSSYSNAASGYSDGSSSAPFLPALIPGTTPLVSPPRNRRDSARNYFAMGSPPKIVLEAATSEGEGVNDKENSAQVASSSRSGPGAPSQASRIPKLDAKMERGPMLESSRPETPKRRRPGRHERCASGGGGAARTRASEDSLGLYDVDGFWISSSPERKSGSGSGLGLGSGSGFRL